MKFEKVNDNKIRIILTYEDLINEDIDFHSFMSNSMDSQNVFLNILDKAEKEIGFVTRKLQNTNRNTSYVWWRFCFYCNKISV